MKTAVQGSPTAVGVELANWSGKGVRQLIQARFGETVSRSTCLRWLHRLGFRYKRPKKQLLKADEAKRAEFVAAYRQLVTEAKATKATIWFADEAHFRADGDLRRKWVLGAEAALVGSSSPRWGEKASYYSAVCLETGEVEAMALEGNSTAVTSTAFLAQLRAKHTGRLIVIWDNGPAHGGDAIREYLATPDLNLQLVRLPAYSPDYNADEAIWGWVRAEVTANTCLGTKAAVQARVDAFFAGLAERKAEVQRRCRTKLQATADALDASLDDLTCPTETAVPICA